MKKTSWLALASGQVFRGFGLAFDDVADVAGELVFSTATGGYTEILTDPSYYGQIVVLAHPEIGNYGVMSRDFQSSGIKVRGLVVRNLSFCASSNNAELTLPDWLMREGIPVLYGVDTRALITHIRDQGSTMAVMSQRDEKDVPDLVQTAKNLSPLSNERLSTQVSVNETTVVRNHDSSLRIVVMDFGVKRAMLHYLMNLGAELILVPPDTSTEEIWSHRPSGLFLSNGPGDPQHEMSAIRTVRAMLGKLPIFGVCLGHQILALATGCSSYKLKFGHRGSNQAVLTAENQVLTTAQNHGYAVKMPMQPLLNCAEDRNISDATNEGIELVGSNAFSVQFHPEGAPGPLDAVYYFEKFIAMVHEWKKPSTINGYASAISPSPS